MEHPPSPAAGRRSRGPSAPSRPLSPRSKYAPPYSPSSWSRCTMFAGRGFGSGTSSSPASASRSHGWRFRRLSPSRPCEERPPREVGRGRVRPLAEGEHVEAAWPCNQRVVLLGDTVDDRVARMHLVRLAVLPRQAAASEDVEDLLLVELDMDRRGTSARIDLSRATPTRFVPAACPRSMRSSCIGPRRRSRASTSSQWTIPPIKPPRSGLAARLPRARAGRSPRGARGPPRPLRSGCPRAAPPCSRSTSDRRGRGSRSRWRRRGR